MLATIFASIVALGTIICCLTYITHKKELQTKVIFRLEFIKIFKIYFEIENKNKKK